MVPAGEVVLNQERAVVAKRFRFDVKIDEVMKALAHRRAGTRAAGLRRTKNSKPHDQSPYSRRASVLARQRATRLPCRQERGRATEPHRPGGPKNELTPRRLPAPPSARSHALGFGRNSGRSRARCNRHRSTRRMDGLRGTLGDQGHRSSASARRPASVIRMRETCIERPPATARSVCAVANPAPIRSTRNRS